MFRPGTPPVSPDKATTGGESHPQVGQLAAAKMFPISMSVPQGSPTLSMRNEPPSGEFGTQRLPLFRDVPATESSISSPLRVISHGDGKIPEGVKTGRVRDSQGVRAVGNQAGGPRRGTPA